MTGGVWRRSKGAGSGKGSEQGKDRQSCLTIYVKRNTLLDVIKTFRDKTTAAVFAGHPVKRLPREILKRAREKLDMLNNAESPDDLRVPKASRLEKLSSNREGQWSIHINDQWRICFEWREGHAWEIEITDYH